MKRLQLSFLLLLALGACKSQPVNMVESKPAGQDLYSKVIFSDRLNEKVRIQDVKKDVKDGYMRVQVDLMNTTRDKKTFMYAFEWFDANGMQVAPTTSIWTQATIFPGEKRSFPQTAGSQSATDFRFKVRAK